MPFDALGPLSAMFAAALLSATILPGHSEVVLGYLLANGEPWQPVLLVATLGNVLGSTSNWAIGRFFEHYRDRRWFPVKPEALEKAERFYARWGKWSLLMSWVPLVGDAFTLVAGLLRIPIIPFLILVTIAKGARYAVVAWGVLAAANAIG